MQKTISIIAMACILIVCPSVYFICQPTEAGVADKTTLDQRLAALDKYRSDGDIVQESIARIKGANPGGGPGGNGDDDSGENSEGDQGDGSDSSGDSGGDSYSGGPKVKSSGGVTSDEIVTAGAMSEGLILDNPIEVVVINEVHPGQEGAFDNRDELVELYNMGRNPVNVSLWYIKNNTGRVIGTIPDNQILPPRGILIVEVTGLAEDSQRVGLFNSKDECVDSVTYVGARSHSGSCFARRPDGLSNWKWAECTLGGSNQWGKAG